jgi:hypothetical protein
VPAIVGGALLLACSGGASPSPPGSRCCPVKLTPSGPLGLSPAAILRRLAMEYRTVVQREAPISAARVARVARYGTVILLDVPNGREAAVGAMGRAMDATFSDRFRAQGVWWLGMRDATGRSYIPLRVLRRYNAGSISRRQLLAAVR